MDLSEENIFQSVGKFLDDMIGKHGPGCLSSISRMVEDRASAEFEADYIEYLKAQASTNKGKK